MTFGIIFQNVCLCLEGGDPDGRRWRGTGGWQRGGQPPWRRVARWRRTVNRWRLVTAGALGFTAPNPPSPPDRHPLCSPRPPPHFRASRKRPHRECGVFGHLSIISHRSSIVTYTPSKNAKRRFFLFFLARKKSQFSRGFRSENTNNRYSFYFFFPLR